MILKKPRHLMLDLYEELKSIVQKLNESRVDYALCGGLALALFGIPRATVDIDILIQRESLEGVQALARGGGYIMRAHPMAFAGGAVEIHRVSKKDEETGDCFSLDFLVVTPPIHSESMGYPPRSGVGRGETLGRFPGRADFSEILERQRAGS
jgi:hypothetical protein